MPAEPARRQAPEQLFRVERPEPPLRFSQIDANTAALDRAGNRFDVIGAGVLYAASVRQGAYAETTAHFRAKASLLDRMRRAGAGPRELQPPAVTAAWRSQRLLRELRTRDALPFLDIEDPSSHTFLTENAPSVLMSNQVETLDVAAVRGPSRTLTRSLASWIYAARDDVGQPQFGGIRYVSRLGDYECWAIFDGTSVELVAECRIAADDPELAAVARRHGIRVN